MDSLVEYVPPARARDGTKASGFEVSNASHRNALLHYIILYNLYLKIDYDKRLDQTHERF